MKRIEPTEAIIDAICHAAEEGKSNPSCAAAGGIGARRLRYWLDRGNAALTSGLEVGGDDRLCAELAERFDRARAVGVSVLEDASAKFAAEGKTTWNQPAWMLERMMPDAFGRREKHEHEHQVRIVIERPPRELEDVEGVAVAAGEDAQARLGLPAAAAAASVP